MGCQFKQGGGLYPRLRIGAVLLAAGEGRRMGGVVKPLIRLQGVPLISRHLVALSGAGVDEVVVVTGHAREAIEAQVQSFPVTLAHNPAYADGQEGSVRVGLGALSGTFDAVFVALADQPMIGAGDLTELMGAFKKRSAGHVVVPVVDGQRICPNRMVYCWQISAIDTGYALKFITGPDEEIFELEPGTGVSRFHYAHHGSTNEVEARLVAYAKGAGR